MDHTKPEHPNALVAKALGGCGIHNAMLYVRGLESDFAKWGVEGFDYASAVEMWKKNENYTGPGPLPKWHGRGGPIATSPPSFIDEVLHGVPCVYCSQAHIFMDNGRQYVYTTKQRRESVVEVPVGAFGAGDPKLFVVSLVSLKANQSFERESPLGTAETPFTEGVNGVVVYVKPR